MLFGLVPQVPDIVRSIEAERVMTLRQQSQLLWHMYFSSIDRIIFTSLEVKAPPKSVSFFLFASLDVWYAVNADRSRADPAAPVARRADMEQLPWWPGNATRLCRFAVAPPVESAESLEPAKG